MSKQRAAWIFQCPGAVNICSVETIKTGNASGDIPPLVSAHSVLIQSFLSVLTTNKNICSGHCEHRAFVTLGLFLSHSAKIRAAGLWAFQPYTAHHQLSCSSSAGLYSGQQGQRVGSRARGQHEKYQVGITSVDHLQKTHFKNEKHT